MKNDAVMKMVYDTELNVYRNTVLN
jgi:hypothetical protein